MKSCTTRSRIAQRSKQDSTTSITRAEGLYHGTGPDSSYYHARRRSGPSSVEQVEAVDTTSKISIDYPAQAHPLQHPPPPLERRDFWDVYRLTSRLRIRSCVPTQTSIQMMGTQQGDMSTTRRTRKPLFFSKFSKWDSNSCRRRCRMWCLPAELPG